MNAEPTEVYYDNLRELMRHAETFQEMEVYYIEGVDISKDSKTSARIYERDALENLIGEAQCVINEVARRINYLETVLAEDV
jgi:hypothetical protein